MSRWARAEHLGKKEEDRSKRGRARQEKPHRRGIENETVAAKSLQMNLESPGFTLCLANAEIESEDEKRRALV